MRLVDLSAHFTQRLPLATGIYTGLYFVCRNDPRRKRGHGILFAPYINPWPNTDDEALLAYLNANDGYRLSPKWQRTGDTLETLTLTPSIAQPCCHMVVTNGEVFP